MSNGEQQEEQFLGTAPEYHQGLQFGEHFGLEHHWPEYPVSLQQVMQRQLIDL